MPTQWCASQRGLTDQIIASLGIICPPRLFLGTAEANDNIDGGVFTALRVCEEVEEG